jgi:class 3 adenylate cyclase
VFSRVIERVHERGGTQLKFGGDALLSLFTGHDHATQAVCAAVDMRRELRDCCVQVATSLGRLSLRMSAGVESGAIHLFLVGDAHHELVVAGPVASMATELRRRPCRGQPPPTLPTGRRSTSAVAPHGKIAANADMAMAQQA